MKMIDIGETWDSPEVAMPLGKKRSEKHYQDIRLKSSKFKHLKELEVGEDVTVTVLLHKTGTREVEREGQPKEDEMTFEIREVGAAKPEEMTDDELNTKIKHAMDVED